MQQPGVDGFVTQERKRYLPALSRAPGLCVARTTGSGQGVGSLRREKRVKCHGLASLWPCAWDALFCALDAAGLSNLPKKNRIWTVDTCFAKGQHTSSERVMCIATGNSASPFACAQVTAQAGNCMPWIGAGVTGCSFSLFLSLAGCGRTGEYPSGNVGRDFGSADTLWSR